jgi:RNA-directed DNA polymerase
LISIDLRSFFDEIPHNISLMLIHRNVADERLVTLIKRALKAGAIVEEVIEKSHQRIPIRLPALTNALQHSAQ